MTEPRDWITGSPVLLVRECAHCGHRFYLPRARCPRCFADRLKVRRAGVTGVTLAVTTLLDAQADGSQFPGLALVDLDDGIRVMARCGPDVQPGSTVVTRFPPAIDGSAGYTPIVATRPS